jgi:hypothetical protein
MSDEWSTHPLPEYQPTAKPAGERFGQLLASVVALLGISAVTITYVGFLVWFWNVTMGWAT